MELELPIKIFILIVAALVVIGIIITFRDRITDITFPCFGPNCEEKSETVEPITVDESQITQTVLEKYCNLCWQKTGAADYKKDTVCYIVKGSFSPISFSHEHCQLKCKNTATSVFVDYKYLDKNIIIEC